MRDVSRSNTFKLISTSQATISLANSYKPLGLQDFPSFDLLASFLCSDFGFNEIEAETGKHEVKW